MRNLGNTDSDKDSDSKETGGRTCGVEGSSLIESAATSSSGPVDEWSPSVDIERRGADSSSSSASREG